MLVLDDDYGYPWRASLTKTARCYFCQNYQCDRCFKGHNLVYPLVNGEHHCKDYVYLPDNIIKYPPRFPECNECSHWFEGNCSGIEWWTKRTKSICEFYRSDNDICKNAIPMLQYKNHFRNNYCMLPPHLRDGDASRGWKWMCPWAHTKNAENMKCYKPLGTDR